MREVSNAITGAAGPGSFSQTRPHGVSRMPDSSTHTGARHFCRMVSELKLELANKVGLVVGYGEGHEAIYLNNALQSRIFGIDVCAPSSAVKQDYMFHPALGDAQRLPFRDGSVDFAFCHHVLEHVKDPQAAVVDIARVLRPGGTLYVATPNHHRLIGCLGAYEGTLRQKVAWNAADYRARLLGRFRNELGAHAGFGRKELDYMLTSRFARVEWVTDGYLLFKHGKRLPGFMLRPLTFAPVTEFAAPAIYALCWK